MKFYYLLIVILFIQFSCSESNKEKETRILYIDSYHESYEPNILTRKAFETNLKLEDIKIEYRFLNSKFIKDESRLSAIASEIKMFADNWKPDLIVAADDSSSKYVISKYYLNSKIPVVFVGVNWDAQKYSFPQNNITGQIEVDLILELLIELKKYTSNRRIGILTGNTYTDNINIKYYQERFGIDFHRIGKTDDFDEWKKSYIAMQDEVDILVLRHNSGINGWDTKEAIKLVNKFNKIPTGSISDSMKNYVHITFAKSNGEFGKYAAKTTETILSGTPPKSIPLSRNSKYISYLNLSIRNNYNFEQSLQNKSEIISNIKKVYFINSYHKGYDWSDGIENGLINTFNSSVNDYLIDLKIFRMDTKLNQTEEYIRSKATEIVNDISNFKPDIILSADDNASKYVIVPYYKNGPIPVIFCGLNWDASAYGFPTDFVTGIVEIAPIQDLLDELKKHSKGQKIGYIGSNTYSERKEIENYKELLGIEFIRGYFVNTVEEFKQRYIELQVTVDILILSNVIGIKDWINEDQYDFILKNTIIPTGSTLQDVSDLVSISFVRIPEEQGEWVGEKAIDYLNGGSFRKIKITTNKQSEITINKSLVDKLKLQLSDDLIKNAKIIIYK